MSLAVIRECYRGELEPGTIFRYVGDSDDGCLFVDTYLPETPDTFIHAVKSFPDEESLGLPVYVLWQPANEWGEISP